MVDFHGLYKSYLQGFKEIGGSQAIALCHNHEDTKPSLSINFDKVFVPLSMIKHFLKLFCLFLLRIQLAGL